MELIFVGDKQFMKFGKHRHEFIDLVHGSA